MSRSILWYMQRDILKYGFLHALLTALYIGLVATFIFYIVPMFFADKPDTIFAPIMMLMLFVFSAAVTGTLVLGRPILWYIDGKKKEAIYLLFSTLLAFFGIMLLTFTFSLVATL